MENNNKNKYQEALDNFKDDLTDIRDCSDNYFSYTTDNDIKLLQELVDKEKPLKPIVIKQEFLLYGADSCYYCGKCEKLIWGTHWEQNYCPYCGQKIDWQKIDWREE